MFSRLKSGLVVLLILCFSIAKGINPDTSVVCKVLHHGWTDTKQLIVSPLKWDAGQWAVAGGVTAVTAALISWGDQPVYNFSNTVHNPFFDAVAPWFEPAEDIYPMVAMSGLLLHGILAKNNYNLETSLIAGESYLMTFMISRLCKYSAGRERPNNNGTTNPHQWSGPFFKGNSFISGHTSATFSVALVFAYRFLETTWVPVVSYTMATLCGLQRIYNNKHWASDVLMGAAVGTATGLFLCHQWEKSPIKFYPVVTKEYSQLTLIIPIR